jgi:hypothetical protein
MKSPLRNLATLCIAHVMLCLGALLQAQVVSPYPAPPFLPPSGHPRVYFRATDVPILLANAQKPQNAKAWAAHLANLSTGTDGTRTGTSSNYSSTVLAIIESYALDYALRGNETYGRNAISAMRNYVRTVVYTSGDYNSQGQTVFTIGLVYDWCYPLLSAADKVTLDRCRCCIAGAMMRLAGHQQASRCHRTRPRRPVAARPHELRHGGL